MSSNQENDKPAINIYYVQRDSSAFCHLLYGIEEEGVPVFLERRNEHSALNLGYEAAIASSLGVGIGIGSDNQIILHYSKFVKDHAMFQISQKDIINQRILGVNAARLVKGIPFRSFKENQITSEEIISKEELTIIVKSVLKKLHFI